MNRSILIIICDFWILSLLALAKFDTPEVQRPDGTPSARQAMAAGEKDVVEVLKLALSEEQKKRDTLASELATTRQSLDQREQAVTARERQVQTLQQSLREKELLSTQLAQQRGELVEQVALTQTNVSFLRQQLQTASTESLLTQEQLKLLQTQLVRKEDELANTRRRVEELDRQRESAQMEKVQLSAQLQVVETEKRLVAQQAGTLSNEVQVVRAEKTALQAHATKLAEGVDALAEKSSALTQEIRENRELASNAIFAELATNRVTVRFTARRKGLFGLPVQHDKEAQTLLVTQGDQYFALCHLSDTPLTFSTPGFGYDVFQVSLERGLVTVPASKLMFLAIDPRLLVIPLGEADAQKLGTKVYRLAADPNKFTEAILVGATEGYYGECKFQIDLSAPLYVRMDRSAFRLFSGKFNPSRGDLVLSKTGELLGMMANNQYCAVISRLSTVAEIVPSSEASATTMGSLLSRFDRALQTLPMKLQ